MGSETPSPQNAQQTSETDSPVEPGTGYSIPVPEHNETLTTRVLPESNGMDGKRRVERVYRRVITDGTHLTFVQPGDYLVRDTSTGVVETRITRIGTDLSETPGIHVLLDEPDPSPLHLDLIRKWISKDQAFVAGRRTQTFSELKGTDY